MFLFPQIPKTPEFSSGADNYSDSQSSPISFNLLNVLILGLSELRSPWDNYGIKLLLIGSL